jgi:hypothetical protein
MVIVFISGPVAFKDKIHTCVLQEKNEIFLLDPAKTYFALL